MPTARGGWRAPCSARPSDDEAAAWQGKLPGYAWAAAGSAAVTLLALPLLAYFDLANIVMLFLLATVLVALKFGRGPAALAAFLNVAAFDYFFVAPRLSFAVSDVQYLVTFGVMLVVGLLTGQLTAGCVSRRASRPAASAARSRCSSSRAICRRPC
jgi:two-component system sensor histidine kinase KdpD